MIDLGGHDTLICERVWEDVCDLAVSVRTGERGE